jgi:hypothetical protein
MGMPTEVFYAFKDNGGNCATMVGVDDKGVVTGSRGCESGATMDEPRTLTPEGRARLVGALDRLRDSPVWEKTSDERCGEGSTLRLTERSGAMRTWAYCVTWEHERARYPKVPEEIVDVLRALDPP